MFKLKPEVSKWSFKLKPADKLLYTFNKSDYVDSEYTLESPSKIINLDIFKKEDD